MYDLLIKNGIVIDFHNNRRILADVGVKDGKIIDVGLCTESSKKVIDAEGLVVSPGFIDIHMHEEQLGYNSQGDDYDIANYMLRMGVTTGLGGNCGINGQDVDDFFNFIDENGAPINYPLLTGHNYIRSKLNMNLHMAASDFEIDKMKQMIKSDIELYGAVGISFGIEYSPGISFDEVVKISEGLGDGIILSGHYRKDSDNALESIKELVDISKATNLPMQISHIGSCSAFGHMDESLKYMEKAIEEGADITADSYPYDSFSTFIGSEALNEDYFQRYNKSYDSILLTEAPYKGVYCDEELYNKVRKEYPNMLAAAFVMNEDEIIEAYKKPFTLVASDGLLNDGQGHPRAAGTFPRILGKFVREDKELDLMDVLKKMTLLPAERLGLKNKGDIQSGMDADITIFNPNTVIDNATFQEPTKAPTGIEYVIIDGKIALEKGKMINKRLGKAIKLGQRD